MNKNTNLSILHKQKSSLSTYFDYMSEKSLDLDILLKRLYNSVTSQGSCTYFTGIGKNQPLAIKTANMFKSLQFHAQFIDPVCAMHGDMGVLRKGDTIIAISRSGTTYELRHFISYVEQNYTDINIYLICQPNKDIRNLYHTSTFVVELPRVEELDKFDLVPTMSNITIQLFLDFIGISFAEMSDLTKETFVKSHPGGYIGEQK